MDWVLIVGMVWQSRGLDDAGLANVIFPADEKNKDNEFWQMISTCYPSFPHLAHRFDHVSQRGPYHRDLSSLSTIISGE